MATGVGVPPRMSVQVMAPLKATTEPRERSNSPMARHIIMARLAMATMLVWTSRFSRLAGVRKAGAAMDRTMNSAASGRSRGTAPTALAMRSARAGPPGVPEAGVASMVLTPKRRYARQWWRRR